MSRAAKWLVLCAPLVVACAVDSTAKKEEEGHQTDPLVRERVMARMDEIGAPAQRTHAKLRTMSQKDQCDGVCELAREVCKAAGRVCELATDYPNDEDVQLKCKWPRADCDEAEAYCENCGGRPEDTEY